MIVTYVMPYSTKTFFSFNRGLEVSGFALNIAAKCTCKLEYWPLYLVINCIYMCLTFIPTSDNVATFVAEQ